MPKITRMYKLRSATATTGNANATLRVTNPGIITSVFWQMDGTGGAGVDARMEVELSKSNVSSLGTNDTPGNVLSGCSINWAVASSAASCNVVHDNLAIPMAVSETLYLNSAFSGTALSSLITNCYVAVLED